MEVETFINQKVIMSSFKEWTTQQLKRTFHLVTLEECEVLDQWLAMPFDIPKKDKQFLMELRKFSSKAIEFWNEDELKFHFITPLLKRVNFTSPHYAPFLERKISSLIENYEMSGRVDFMVASGEYEPVKPYFFFSEYKKEKGGLNDPLAQVLCAMMVAQQKNKDDKPVYGAYVIGRNWFFVVLQGKEYCKSEVFTITRQEYLEQVYILLMNMKRIIEEQLL